MYTGFVKPLCDFGISILILTLLSPVFILIAAALYAANRGSIIFKQPRIGRNNRPFDIIKFKTMNDSRDYSGALLPDSKRLTKTGKLIRSLSLDEFPQLINILKGDMSLIGPRPLLPKYLPLYTATQASRHNIKPGITGWAQVNGRNSITWEQKFDLDVHYVNNLNIFLDLKILIMTLSKVVLRKDVNSSALVSMPTFTGTKA